MTDEVCLFLHNALLYSGIDHKIVDYSARRMYGKVTKGIILADPDEILTCVVDYVINKDPDEIVEVPELHRDDMGMKQIVY